MSFLNQLKSQASANFPPDPQRIEKRLADGSVKHERIKLRHPEKNTLLAVKFDYITGSRGSFKISADHEAAKLSFRVANASGFDVLQPSWPAAQMQTMPWMSWQK